MRPQLREKMTPKTNKTPFISYLNGGLQNVFNPHSHPNGFYLGYQYSWTLTLDNSMQIPKMQSYNRIRKLPGLRPGYILGLQNV